MGTEVHGKSYLPGYYSMRDTNDDCNSSSWPPFYGDKSLTNGHCYNGFMPRTTSDASPGYEKDALKQKMLEHEAVFKHQVYELHRLYRRQRDMMEEFKMKEIHKRRISTDASSSLSPLPSQIRSEGSSKWNLPCFPLANSNGSRPSIFGAEIVNSPLSCTNVNSLKNSEGLEHRPSKVRKMLFDLELPADAYIDTEEEEREHGHKMPVASVYPQDRNNGKDPKSGGKLFNNGDTSSNNACLRSSNLLADLNEPINVEETNGQTSVDVLGHSARPPSQFVGLPQDFFGKSQNGCYNVKLVNGSTSHFLGLPEEGFRKSENRCSNGTSIKTPIESQGNERDWLPCKYESGTSKSQDHSKYNHALPGLPSRVPSSYPFSSSSDMGNSWSQHFSSWGNPSSILTHNLTSVHKHPSYLSSATLMSSLSSPQNQESFGEKWYGNGNSRSNMGRVRDMPTKNGFHPASSSWSKEPCSRVPSASLGYLSCNNSYDVAPGRLINHGPEKLLRGSNFIDLEAVNDKNPNIDQNLSNGIIPQQGKPDLPPWLRAKPSSMNNSSRDHLSKDGAAKDQHESSIDNVSSVLHDKTMRNIIPFSGNPCTTKTDESSLASTSASLHQSAEGENLKKEVKQCVIDINVEPCLELDVDAFVVEKETESKGSFKNHFDLNSCVTEEEELVRLDIDLEALPVPEIEEAEAAQQEGGSQSEDEEFVRVAAEAIVVMSTSGPRDEVGSTSEVVLVEADSSENPLMWFVEVISTCKDAARKFSPYEIDEYEAMTLQLEDMKEEEYMPKAFYPEIEEAEETSPGSVPTRPRRGQGRRGRQRRDFQKDILPGLVSLSRHEVTEDLQTFGGLMRATGHPWNSGLTRRNGSRGAGRGRRKLVGEPTPPLVEQLNNIEAGLDERSLTGWGKTTRRPRRQRCPPQGNAAANTTTA